MNIADIWITREPSISDGEWRSLVKTRDDFVVSDATKGETRDGVLVDLGEIFFWTGGSSGEVAFAFTEDGIHVSPIDPEAYELVRDLACQLGASLYEP